MSTPVLEFVGMSRPAFALSVPEVLIGRTAACTVQVDVSGVAPTHARIFVDGNGVCWLEDLGSGAATRHNGQPVTEWVELKEGDRIELGKATLIFRAVAAEEAVQAPAQGATMISDEAPAVVRELVARQKAEKEAAARAKAGEGVAPPSRPSLAAKPTVPARPAAMPAGARIPSSAPLRTPATTNPATPSARHAAISGERRPPSVAPAEDEGEALRTVQMDAPNFAALGVPAARKAPPATQRGPAVPASRPVAPARPAASVPRPFAGTVMGIGGPTESPEQAFAAAAQGHPQEDQGATQHELAAPKVPKPFAATMPSVAHQQQQQAAPTATGFDTPPQGTPAPSPQAGVMPWQQAVLGAPSAVPEAFAETALPYAMPPGVTAPLPAQPSQKTPPMVEAVGGLPGGSSSPTGAPFQSAQPYEPPKKGPLGSISRALDFYGQMFSLAKQNRELVMPMIYDVGVTAVLSVVLGVLSLIVPARADYALLGLGTFLLYFVDYLCNSMTASLIYDQVTSGRATARDAFPRVRNALSGILVFAAVSALLELGTTMLREIDHPLARALRRFVMPILMKIWSTATYCIMPALVIEGVSFATAFQRSKKLMAQDPTGVGAGIVAMGLTSYLVGAVCFTLAYFALRLGSHIHFAVGIVLFLFFANLYWAVSGWMKIAYSTCFYLWAAECERTGTQDAALAPTPLRHAMDAG